MSEPEPKKRGRPPLPPEQRKPRKSGPSGKSGKARPPSPEQVAAVRDLIRRVDPANAYDGRGFLLARAVGVEPSRVSAILAGKRGISGAMLEWWGRLVDERIADPTHQRNPGRRLWD